MNINITKLQINLLQKKPQNIHLTVITHFCSDNKVKVGVKVHTLMIGPEVYS